MCVRTTVVFLQACEERGDWRHWEPLQSRWVGPECGS